MDGARTRGQPAASAAVRGMIGGRSPHALLLVGPSGAGKTTLALDLAAGLLCTAPDPDDRPCRACRACRLVESGNHPDIHWLRPQGPGDQIVIERDPPRLPNDGVRDLVAHLALLPIEGAARVAIVERAHRLNEDAQNALLKMLEEPPAGVTIVLCADDDERLLPTVRSRCARLRLGPVGTRDIEGLLAELGLADPPTAARLARLAGGRPGRAIALARAPDALRARDEVARSLLDLLSERRARRLLAVRGLLARAAEAIEVTDESPEAPEPEPPAIDAPVADAPVASAPAHERRRALAWLLEAWRDVAHDLAVVGMGGRRGLRDPGLVEELEAVASRLPAGAAGSFLSRLAAAGERLEANVSPELLADVLILAWPRARAAA